MAKLETAPDDLSLLNKLGVAAKMVKSLPFGVDLWRVQDIYYRMLPTVYPQFQKRAEAGDELAREWLSRFSALGGQLSVRVT